MKSELNRTAIERTRPNGGTGRPRALCRSSSSLTCGVKMFVSSRRAYHFRLNFGFFAARRPDEREATRGSRLSAGPGARPRGRESGYGPACLRARLSQCLA